MLANLAVALAITALQVVVLIAAAVLRGADLDTSVSGIAWFVARRRAARPSACTASPRPSPTASRQSRSTSARCPAIAIVPLFFAGSLFPITALPGLPHRLRPRPAAHPRARADALRPARQPRPALHDIWGMSNPTEMAALSLAVVAAFAVVFSTIAVRMFRQSVQS